MLLMSFEIFNLIKNPEIHLDEMECMKREMV